MSDDVINSSHLNTGVIRADPASAKWVVQMMKRLTDYVPLPNGPGEEPYTIACHGDQLWCEGMVNARFAMGDHDLPVNTKSTCSKNFPHLRKKMHSRQYINTCTRREMFNWFKWPRAMPVSFPKTKQIWHTRDLFIVCRHSGNMVDSDRWVVRALLH